MRWSLTFIALAFAAGTAAFPAFGQSATPRPPQAPAHQASTQTFTNGSNVPCICRAEGRTFLEGESICLNGVVAYCDKEQNVTTWRMTPRTCPQS